MNQSFSRSSWEPAGKWISRLWQSQAAIQTLFLVLVLSICTIPSLLLMAHRVADPYFNTVASQTIAAFDSGRMVPVTNGEAIVSDPYAHGHVGYNAIILALSKLTGILPRYIQFLPIGGILVPFLYYALTITVTGSHALAALMAIYMAFEPMLSQNHYNVHAYVWSTSLLLVFLLLCVRALDHRSWHTALALTVIYVGTFLVYWITPLWMACVWGWISVQKMLARIGKPIREGLEGTISLVIAFGVIYLMFSKPLYEYLPDVLGAVYGGPNAGIGVFVWRLTEMLGWNRDIGPYEFAGAPTNVPIIGWLLALRYIISSIPMAILLVVRVADFAISRSFAVAARGRLMPLVLGSLIAVAAHVGVYLARGHVSIRPAILLFPLVGLLSMGLLRWPRSIQLVYAATLGLIAVLGFHSNLGNLRGYIADTSGQWILKHYAGATVLTDLDTAQAYLLEEVETGRWIQIRLYDEESYKLLVEGLGRSEMADPEVAPWQLVAVDVASSELPLLSRSWQSFKPLATYLPLLHESAALERVYDEGRFIVLRTRRSQGAIAR